MGYGHFTASRQPSNSSQMGWASIAQADAVSGVHSHTATSDLNSSMEGAIMGAHPYPFKRSPCVSGGGTWQGLEALMDTQQSGAGHNSCSPTWPWQQTCSTAVPSHLASPLAELSVSSPSSPYNSSPLSGARPPLTLVPSPAQAHWTSAEGLKVR